MKSVKEMQAEPDPTNNILVKSIKPIMDTANKPSKQVLKDGSDYNDRRVYASICGKMKHLFSKGGINKNKIPRTTEAYPAIKSSESIKRHREFLEDHIEPDFGLLDKLLTDRILSRREILDVQDKSPFYARNSQLLKYILEKDQADQFIKTLRDTGQMHIVNYLHGNGGEYGNTYPSSIIIIFFYIIRLIVGVKIG